MRLFVTGGSKFDPADRPRPVRARLHHPPGLRPHRDLRRRDHQHAGRSAPRHGRPRAAGHRDQDPAAGGRGADGEIAIRGPIVMQGYLQPARRHRRGDARTAGSYTGDLGRLDARRPPDDHRPQEGDDRPRVGQEHLSGRDRGALSQVAVREGDLRDGPGRARTSRRASGCTRVVVPDMDVLRERKIVNAGDILRFEMEGLAAGLPPHKRVLGYDIWFEPLPRTTTQKIKRHEVERRVRERQRDGVAGRGRRRSRRRSRVAGRAARGAAVLAVMRRAAESGRACLPDANLELDLGLRFDGARRAADRARAAVRR